MQRRKVLLYSDGYAYSGAEKYLLELARGIPRDRFEVEAVASDRGAVDGFVRDLEAISVPVRRLPALATLGDRKAFMKVWKHLATRRPHVVHWNLVDPRSCTGGMVAARLAGLRRFVATEHLPNSPFDTKPLPFRVRFGTRALKTSIVFTEEYRQLVRARPWNRSRVVVIPNGIPDPGAPTPTRRLAARETLGLVHHQGPVIGWMGRAAPQKNLDLLIEGARRVLPRRPDALFAVLGDGPLLEEGQAKVRELGLSEGVRFYGFRSDARDLVGGFDALVNTSRYEGMPFAILEAMAAGVAVIGPAINGVRELIADRASGRIYPEGDGEALGRALLEAIEEPQTLKQYGAVARQRMLTLFSSETMVRKTVELYGQGF